MIAGDDGGAEGRAALRERASDLDHLLRQLRRREDDQRAHLARRRAPLLRLCLPQPLDEGRHVGERLARAGLVRDDGVLAARQRREGERLHVRRRLRPRRRESRDELL